jgi:hypothetical protein
VGEARVGIGIRRPPLRRILQAGSVRPQTMARTVAPFWVVTVCTQPLGRCSCGRSRRPRIRPHSRPRRGRSVRRQRDDAAEASPPAQRESGPLRLGRTPVNGGLFVCSARVGRGARAGAPKETKHGATAIGAPGGRPARAARLHARRLCVDREAGARDANAGNTTLWTPRPQQE